MHLENFRKEHQKWIILGFALVFGLIAIFLLGSAGQVSAAPPQEGYARGNKCTDCHTEPDRTLTLDSGEMLYTTIESEAYAASAHGDSYSGFYVADLIGRHFSCNGGDVCPV